MVDTYVDPKTDKAYDFGVLSFLDLGNASAFFDRFNIESAPLAHGNTTTEYIDSQRVSP